MDQLVLLSNGSQTANCPEELWNLPAKIVLSNTAPRSLHRIPRKVLCYCIPNGEILDLALLRMHCPIS